MIEVKVGKINFGEIAQDEIARGQRALYESMEDLRQMIIEDEVIPYSDIEVEQDENGNTVPHIHMQETMDKVEVVDENTCQISLTKPYARKVYYGTNFNFNQTHNRQAKAMFFDDYGPDGVKYENVVGNFKKHLNE